MLRDNLVYSFYDLSEDPWAAICEIGTVEAHDTAMWAADRDPDPDRERRFVDLLGSALSDQLHPKGISFSRPHGMTSIAPPGTSDHAINRYRRRQNAATRVVFKGYAKKTAPDQIACYRHAAFEGRFTRFNGDWFLIVSPTYHFTRDGFTPSLYGDEWVSGQKRLEHNESVDGQVAMWAAPS